MFSVSNRDALQRLKFLTNALAGEMDRRRSGLYQTKYSCLSSPDKRRYRTSAAGRYSAKIHLCGNPTSGLGAEYDHCLALLRHNRNRTRRTTVSDSGLGNRVARARFR
jgi:hypothetical protein